MASTFNCAVCGAKMPVDTLTCPACGNATNNPK